MQKTLCFIACTLALGARAQDAVTATAREKDSLAVTAHIKELKAGLPVYWRNLGSDHKDSALTHDGGFEFHLHIGEGEGNGYLLQVGKEMKDGALTLVYLDKGQLILTGDGPLLEDVHFSGSPFASDQEAFANFQHQDSIMAGVKDLYKKAQDLYRKKDTAAFNTLQPALDKVRETQIALTKKWIAAHPSSPYSAYLLKRNLSFAIPLEEQGHILATLTPAALNNMPAKDIAHSIEVDRQTGIGREAPGFTQSDTAGRPVSLKDFRGKYVLVDFWASWCVPCRQENPNVVAAFHTYGNRGFTVLGVSLDRSGGKDNWLKAIRADGLTWTQVSDLNFWNNAVAKQYDIQSIPSNILVGPDGKVVAKNLHEEALGQTLDSLLPGVFTLNGQIKGATDGMLYLYFTGADGKGVHDSCRLRNGAFSFTGGIKEPTMATLYLDRENATEVFLESGTMTLEAATSELKDATIRGSKTQSEFQELNNRLKPIQDEEKPLADAYAKENNRYIVARKERPDDPTLDSMKEHLAKMHEAFEPYNERMMQETLHFFTAHPQSYVTANYLRFYTGRLSLDSLETYYRNLGPVVGSQAGKLIAKEIAKIKAGSPGSVAADFAATDINGTLLHLSDFRGRYVLLDFWASWCVPCRHGNPHLREVYQRYHGEGFDIISVSDDDNNHDAWKKAVTKDSIGIWHHVLRGLDWSKINQGVDNPNDISEKFGISSLPTKILIDPSGKIVGRYDETPEALDAKLAQIFHQQNG